MELSKQGNSLLKHTIGIHRFTVPAKDISEMLNVNMSLNQLQGFLCALKMYCNHFLQCPLSPGPHPSSSGSAHHLCPATCSPTEAQTVPVTQSWLNLGWCCGYLGVTCQPLWHTPVPLHLCFSVAFAGSAVAPGTAVPQHPAYLSLPGLSARWLPAELPHPATPQLHWQASRISSPEEVYLQEDLVHSEIH